MDDIKAIRIANARSAIEKAGGVGKVAALMGYANASFLVQQFGPHPTRNPSEKTMRRIEEALGLEAGILDRRPEVHRVVPSSDALSRAENKVEMSAEDKRAVTGVSKDLLTSAVSLIGALQEQEAVTLSPEKFAALVAMAYEDGADAAAESRLRKVVQLLRD